MSAVVIAALTLVVTTIGAYYTWRTFRQGRVAAPIEAAGLNAQVYPDSVSLTVHLCPVADYALPKGAEVKSQVYRFEERRPDDTLRISLSPVGDPDQPPPQKALEELFKQAERPVSPQREKEPPPEIPRWSLALFASEDAKRYEAEWNAHLFILIEDGNRRQASRVRRRLALRAVFLAVEVRARRAFRRRGARR
jgi:hypothetical protein